jgi:exodeoxyribonuclease X
VKIIVIDTETTGVDPLADKLVELAAINLDTDLSFETLINPGRDIPPEAMAVHHITEWMVAESPTPEQAVTTFIRGFAAPTSAKPDSADLPIFAAHNAKFDRGMLEPLLGHLRPQWLCTYKIALNLWPDAPRHTNQVLRYWLGLKPQIPEGLAPHRAMYDIICTREILRTAMLQAPLDKLLHWSNNPVLLKRVQFGKHAGKPWSEVDVGYLRWVTQQSDMNEDVLFTANYWLDKLGARNGGRRGW